MATVAPSRALIPDFAGLLAIPVDPAATIRIEGASGIGWPLEVAEWIAMIERRLGRLWCRQTRSKAASRSEHRTASAAAVNLPVNCHRYPALPNGNYRIAIITL